MIITRDPILVKIKSTSQRNQRVNDLGNMVYLLIISMDMHTYMYEGIYIYDEDLNGM